MPPRVRPLERASAAAWDAFVTAHPDGSFFHRAAWAGVIAAAFRHRTDYLFAEQDGAISGVLPLVHMRTLLFGNTLVSTPFCVTGGPLARDAASRAVLLDRARDLMRGLGASALELRTPRAPDANEDWPAYPEGWQVRDDLYCGFRRKIAPDHEANMQAIPRKQRAMVRKGIANGLSATQGRSLDPFFRVYAESVRNLGTPMFPRRYFRLLLDAFPDCSDITTVHDGGIPIAAVLNFYFRDEVLPYYGGGTRLARNRAANDFMYWQVMRQAADRGCRVFDFGRSKIGTGAYDFKRNWGFVPQPLAYRYLLAPGAKVPDHNPLNPKYRLFIAAWRHLPLGVANLIGPHIVRGVG
jgi:FemAB-related protein (PEP-CTERM system-associated)